MNLNTKPEPCGEVQHTTGHEFGDEIRLYRAYCTEHKFKGDATEDYLRALKDLTTHREDMWQPNWRAK